LDGRGERTTVGGTGEGEVTVVAKVLTQREFPSISQLELRVDGVTAVRHRDNAVDATSS